ncbi:F-box only protein 21 [Eumeta japonica]|uniref:F-box only protein 21 n=1 Tax=Eumeta variegata TaxID=151549 RepID=A0A4C1UW93_EUMVA|nr:F-box only protein 21 [Eumeta japonica]
MAVEVTEHNEGSTLNLHGYYLETIAMGRDTNMGKGTIDILIRSYRQLDRSSSRQFASSGVSAQTVKTGYFVFPHSAGLAYMRITALKISRLRSTLCFSMPISAAVLALDRRINELVDNVEKLLREDHPLRSVKPSIRKEWAHALIDDNAWKVKDSLEILAAIRNVIYQQKRMSVTAEATIHNLDIVKVMNSKYANAVLVLSIFAAVARQCGVRCDLIAFPDHLFLEWKESFTEPSIAFHINHVNGELEKKRQCPFASSNMRQYKYNPDYLLHYLYSSYAKSMGSIRDWSIQNVLYLAGFLHYINDNANPYKHFLEYLQSNDLIVFYKLRKLLGFECMRDFFYKDILALVNLNSKADKSCRKIQPKARTSSLKFAVGMICYHLKYDYICIVRDWDPVCAASAGWQQRMAINGLEYGSDQPFYTVIAADYSNRYVAQENLRVKLNPSRMTSLEEVIAREFSHFDGFTYVPNVMKEAEYPEDGAVRKLYRMRQEIQRSASVEASTAGGSRRHQQHSSTV